jgi:hypothetical protein
MLIIIELASPQHTWSAASKESIHLGMLARALDPNGRVDALNFFHLPYPGKVTFIR